MNRKQALAEARSSWGRHRRYSVPGGFTFGREVVAISLHPVDGQKDPGVLVISHPKDLGWLDAVCAYAEKSQKQRRRKSPRRGKLTRKGNCNGKEGSD